MTFDIYNIIVIGIFIGVFSVLCILAYGIVALNRKYPDIISWKLLLILYVVSVLSMCSMPIADNYREREAATLKGTNP